MNITGKRLKTTLRFNGLSNKLLFFIGVSIFATSCGKSIYVATSDVEAIRFFYLPKGVHTIHTVQDYQDIFSYNIVQDTVIYDRRLIDQYIGFINELKPKKERNNDFRTYSLVKFKDDSEYLRLGFGENFGTVVGQQQMKDNPKLFRWLHALLYSGPYKNLPPHMYEKNTAEE